MNRTPHQSVGRASAAMALPLALMMCGGLSLAALALWSATTGGLSALEAQLSVLRQREWAWVGLKAAVVDIHAPRVDARHPQQLGDTAPTTRFVPRTVAEWSRWPASPGPCQSGLCPEQSAPQSPSTWAQRVDGQDLPLQGRGAFRLTYWIEPLLQVQADASEALAFRITVRVDDRLWQAWWRPHMPFVADQATGEALGEWLSWLELSPS